jgi:hypothetical protein
MYYKNSFSVSINLLSFSLTDMFYFCKLSLKYKKNFVRRCNYFLTTTSTLRQNKKKTLKKKLKSQVKLSQQHIRCLNLIWQEVVSTSFDFNPRNLLFIFSLFVYKENFLGLHFKRTRKTTDKREICRTHK